MLADLYFGISDEEKRPKYNPTFRSLFSFFVRRGRDAFAAPFSHHRSQKTWDKQVNNAFLLGLEWQHAAELQDLKDEENLLRQLRRAAQQDLLAGMIGTLGSLEAERARLETEIRQQSESLESFRVHPQYNEIEEDSNHLTSLIHDLSNENLVALRLLTLYQEALDETNDTHALDVAAIYQEADVTFPEILRRRLEEVQTFHTQILVNRHAYLNSEIQRIERARNQREMELKEAIERRSKLLDILQTHGALQEYTRLQELHLDVIARRNDIDNRIANLNKFEQGRSDVRVRRELLLQNARRDFDERRESRGDAINLFNSNSQALYNSPGNLILDIADTGFTFDVDIVRSESSGINNMKIFCYDVMLAQLWSTKQSFGVPLVHDSTIFDGVDERQVAEALELAQRESEKHGFQYICALNSDKVPSGDFSPEFDLSQFEILRLTDETEEGGLLGIRY